jgi:hypothetical protein
MMKTISSIGVMLISASSSMCRLRLIIPFGDAGIQKNPVSPVDPSFHRH